MPAASRSAAPPCCHSLPALKVTRARVQPHLANLGTGGATLRFGRVWTTAMIAQVALTAMAIPVAFESASQALRNMGIRAEFPSREYLAARLELDRPSAEEAAAAFADAADAHIRASSSGASRRNLAWSR